jgi:hypothetical protein
VTTQPQPQPLNRPLLNSDFELCLHKFSLLSGKRILGIPTHGYRTREVEVKRIFGQSAKETRVTIAQQRERKFSIA